MTAMFGAPDFFGELGVLARIRNSGIDSRRRRYFAAAAIMGSGCLEGLSRLRRAPMQTRRRRTGLAKRFPSAPKPATVSNAQLPSRADHPQGDFPRGFASALVLHIMASSSIAPACSAPPTGSRTNDAHTFRANSLRFVAEKIALAYL